MAFRLMQLRAGPLLRSPSSLFLRPPHVHRVWRSQSTESGSASPKNGVLKEDQEVLRDLWRLKEMVRSAQDEGMIQAPRNLRALGYAPKDAKLPEGGEDSITTFGGIPFSHEERQSVVDAVAESHFEHQDMYEDILFSGRSARDLEELAKMKKERSSSQEGNEQKSSAGGTGASTTAREEGVSAAPASNDEDKKEENWTKDYFVRRSNQIFSDREPDEEFPEPYNFEEEIPSDEEEQLMKEQEENELREAQKFLQQDAAQVEKRITEALKDEDPNASFERFSEQMDYRVFGTEDADDEREIRAWNTMDFETIEELEQIKRRRYYEKFQKDYILDEKEKKAVLQRVAEASQQSEGSKSLEEDFALGEEYDDKKAKELLHAAREEAVTKMPRAIADRLKQHAEMMMLDIPNKGGDSYHQALPYDGLDEIHVQGLDELHNLEIGESNRVMPDFPEMRQGRGEKGPDDDVPIDGDAESHRDLDRLLDSDMNAERMAMEARAGLDMQDHDYESASDDDYYSSSFREMGDQEISEVEDLAELARNSIKPGLGPFDRYRSYREVLEAFMETGLPAHHLGFGWKLHHTPMSYFNLDANNTFGGGPKWDASARPPYVHWSTDGNELTHAVEKIIKLDMHAWVAPAEDVAEVGDSGDETEDYGSKNRYVEIHWKRRLMYIIEETDDAQAEQRSRAKIVEIPPDWLTAFKKVRWPPSGSLYGVDVMSVHNYPTYHLVPYLRHHIHDADPRWYSDATPVDEMGGMPVQKE